MATPRRVEPWPPAPLIVQVVFLRRTFSGQHLTCSLLPMSTAQSTDMAEAAITISLSGLAPTGFSLTGHAPSSSRDGQRDGNPARTLPAQRLKRRALADADGRARRLTLPARPASTSASRPHAHGPCVPA